MQARAELTAGPLSHISATENAFGDCFNMGLHRIENSDHSIVSLLGLGERNLGMSVHGTVDVTRDAKDSPFVKSLR